MENNQLCAVCAHRRGDWKKEIPSQLNPRTKPCWGNANMDMWERNAWQIAKVFMTYGQETRTGPSDTDPIGLLQLVINCKLFTSCVTNMKSFEDVKEIRNKVFHSADFKLSSTELDDYIKAMTTLLEDPMQLKTDAKAKKAVLLLQQIKTFPLETNDTQVLQTERTMWKTKIEEMSKGHSLTEKEVKNVLDFISKQEDLNETFKDDIEPLNKTVEELKAVQQLQGRNVSQLQLQQQQQGRDVSQLQLQLQQQGRDVSQLKEQGNELVVWVTKSENAQKETQEKQAEQQKQHESLVGKQAELDERVTKVEDIVKRPANIKEELQKLKEQLRDAQQRKIQKYLKNTKFFKNIALEKFSDLYVEPHVYESGEYKRLETRSDINSLQLEMKIEQCKQVKVEELLSPDPDRGMTALKVLITGSAGSGKSMLSLQLLNMWLQGQLPAFEDIFFYSMKELSIVKGSSLADLLFMHQYIYKRPSDEVAIEYVQQMSQKTLVVFEGLDAFGGYSSESETFDCNQDIEMSRLIGSIISGNTLKLVTLLVTSRPGGVNDYKKFDRVAEIYGFVEPMIDEYVHKYCEGDDMLEYHIGSYIDSNINVSSLCHLPIFCSLVCRIGKVGLLRDQKAPFPTTLTQLVTKYVDIFVREQHPRFTEKELRQRDNVIAEIKDQLLHHSKLAKDGMCHQPVKLNFSNEDVKELSQQAATQCGFLNVSKEKKQATVHAKVTQSYFVHLMMQEFFAAIALVSSLEETEKLLKQTPNEGQLDMVLTFISGLVGDPESRPFLESLGYNTITKAANPENQKILEAMGYKTIVTASELLGLVVTQCVINERKPRRRNHKASILLLLRLVYESRQPYLWSEIKDFVLNGGTELDLSDTPITSDELQALTFVVQKSSDITSVDLRNCKKTGDCGTHIGKLLQLRLEIRQ